MTIRDIPDGYWSMTSGRRPWDDQDCAETFKTRILVEPGKTREPTSEEMEQLPCLDTACEAEEIFGLDYLERFAAGRE